MKFLHINNVTSLTGGTARFTHDVTKCFPDCLHTVYSLSGSWSQSDRDAFGSNCELITGSNPTQYARDNPHDVLVFNNTRADLLPSQRIGQSLSVYVAHSATESARQAANRTQKQFVVSEWLKQKLKVDYPVLYQPIQKPNRLSIQTPENEPFRVWYDKQIEYGHTIIGRICTPSARKWKLSDWTDVFTAVDDDNRYLKSFHFVGATGEAIDWVCDNIKSPVFVSNASPDARGFMPYWDVLLNPTTIPESYGRVINESRRVGCVPVVSRIAGFIEQIDDTIDGRLCDTAEQFVEACFDVKHHRSFYRQSCIEIGDRMGSLQTFRKNFLELLTT